MTKKGHTWRVQPESGHCNTCIATLCLSTSWPSSFNGTEEQFLPQGLHIVADLLLSDPGIDLGSANTPMHLTDGFDGYIVFQGDGGGKSMPGNMGGQLLTDPAKVG